MPFDPSEPFELQFNPDEPFTLFEQDSPSFDPELTTGNEPRDFSLGLQPGELQQFQQPAFNPFLTDDQIDTMGAELPPVPPVQPPAESFISQALTPVREVMALPAKAWGLARAFGQDVMQPGSILGRRAVMKNVQEFMRNPAEAQGTKEFQQSSLGNLIPDVAPATPDMSKVEKALRGLAQGSTEFIRGLTSAENMALLLMIGKMPTPAQKAVGVGFLSDIGGHAAQSAADAGTAAGEGDIEGAFKAGAVGAGEAGLAFIGGRHMGQAGVRGKALVKQTERDARIAAGLEQEGQAVKVPILPNAAAELAKMQGATETAPRAQVTAAGAAPESAVREAMESGRQSLLTVRQTVEDARSKPSEAGAEAFQRAQDALDRANDALRGADEAVSKGSDPTGMVSELTDLVAQAVEAAKQIPITPISPTVAAVEASKAPEGVRIPPEASKPVESPQGAPKITHFKHKDGRGLLDRSAWDLSKLTDNEELSLPDLLDFGLQQPRDVPAGSKFYFTEEGLKKHAKLIRLIRKASKSGGLVKETSSLTSDPVWESRDGQVAVTKTVEPPKPASVEAVETPSIQEAVSLAQFFDPINMGSLLGSYQHAHKAGYIGREAQQAAWSLYQASREVDTQQAFPTAREWFAKTKQIEELLRSEASEAAQRLVGTTGDLGQGDLLGGGPPDLFAPPAPKIKPAEVKAEQGAQGEHARTSKTDNTFERARKGEDSAFDDLDGQFREIYPEPEEFARPGQPNPNQVRTPEAFRSLFEKSFAARDFDAVLNAIKATSDVSIWKPFMKEQFAKQAAGDRNAALKVDWLRAVFNGQRPEGAAPPKPPRAAPTPQPTATPPRPGATPPRPGATPPRPGATPPRPGATPPRPGATPPRPGATQPPPPQPPGPTPTRIPVEPIPGGGAKSPYQIIEDFSASIGKAIRVLRMKKGGLGVYRPGSTLTAERFAGDLDTAAHELAGHWTDDRYGIGKPWMKPRTRSPYDAELAKFWIHGSVTPKSTLKYRRAEGIAEFIRAYVVNPNAAKLEAPNFHAYFERTLPPQALKAVNDFGMDVRRWAGEDPILQGHLNMRLEPPTLTERLWKGLRGRGFGFDVSWVDKLRLMFDDPYHYAVKASKQIQELRGGTALPSKNFELMARLLATHDSRMGNQFEHGLVPLRPGQVTNAKGQLDVQRLIDPVTNKPMTLEWLMETFDKKNVEAMQFDLKDVGIFMVAQRTLEKGAQFGRDVNISGIGAGIKTDTKWATESLARFAADPARQTSVTEGARRYRLWADQNIQMLVDSGRLSAEQAKDIRDKNQHYVDMHRLSEEFETGFRAQHGRNIGTGWMGLKRFKGSSKQIDNVYSNLLEQTDSIQREAHRNVVMNTFVDGLRNVRELYGPDLKDFAQFGVKASQGDARTIKVFVNGKVEHWQFEKSIYESLKGMGELGTHPFINAIALPSQFARYLITQSPQFITRNIVRDTLERTVQSRSGSKPWDILNGYSDAALSRYEVFGGGQFGNYMVDKQSWNKSLKRVMQDLSNDKTTILLSPLKLKSAWENLSSASEKLGRTAEFQRAFERGKKELGYDDYNAALFAAGEARGLLDFAKAGTVMRDINRLIPFSNAGMRGLGRTFSGFKENPANYAMRWGTAVLIPTLAVMNWNLRDEKTWNEYMQLPAYRRDFFWNLKVGSHWITIPKPHLLGVLAGGVERAFIRAMGDKRGIEGYAGSIAANLPIRDITEATGPLKVGLELLYNKDTFRNREIIPFWEVGLDLELRKGTERASGTGKTFAEILNSTGLTIDPRQVDHVLNSYGGLGQITTSATKSDRALSDTALKSTGFVGSSPVSESRDVQWVMSWAKRKGKLNSSDITNLKDLMKEIYEEKDPKKKAAMAIELRKAATTLRDEIEKYEKEKR